MSKRPHADADADADADTGIGTDCTARSSAAAVGEAEALSGIAAKRHRQAIEVEPRLPAQHGISAPLIDRKSTFVGYFAAVRDATELKAASRHVRALAQRDGADHVIRAWRYKSSFGAGWATDYDDDGEAQAGKRLLEWLKTSLVEGLVVCTRVYGGVLLGPVRFHHIVQVCADAVADCTRKKKENSDRLRRLCDARARTIRSLCHAKGVEVDAGIQLPNERQLVDMKDVELQRVIEDADAEVKRLRGLVSQTVEVNTSNEATRT